MQCKNVRIKLCLLEAKLCLIILDFKLTLPSKASVYNDPECSEEPEARAELFRNEGQQKPEVVFVPIWYLIHSFSEQVSILRYQILWKEDVLIWHLCMPLRDSNRKKLSNQFYKSCRTQIRYDTFINERGPATTIEPENWNGQIQKFPKFTCRLRSTAMVGTRKLA